MPRPTKCQWKEMLKFGFQLSADPSSKGLCSPASSITCHKCIREKHIKSQGKGHRLTCHITPYVMQMGLNVLRHWADIILLGTRWHTLPKHK